MSIPDIDQITTMGEDSLPTLRKILDDIRRVAAQVRLTATLPTANTVQQGEIVIYDDGAGTKRLYTKTGKGNLSWVALT